MVRVLKLARIFDTKTGTSIKEFEKIGLPNFKQDTEDLMGGVGKRKIGLGFEQPEIEIETQGEADFMLPYFGSEAGIRIIGSYQAINGQIETREIIARGNVFEHGRGDMELNKKEANGKPKLSCVFYREKIGNKIINEYDWDNDVLIVNGVNLMAAHKENMA